MDYAMPRLDGIGLLQRLAREHPNLPVILMTGENLKGVRAKADAVSARLSPSIIAKPLDADLLCQSIRAAGPRRWVPANPSGTIEITARWRIARRPTGVRMAVAMPRN
jgi:CheY-like chemotaxis protein